MTAVCFQKFFIQSNSTTTLATVSWFSILDSVMYTRFIYCAFYHIFQPSSHRVMDRASDQRTKVRRFESTHGENNFLFFCQIFCVNFCNTGKNNSYYYLQSLKIFSHYPYVKYYRSFLFESWKGFFISVRLSYVLHGRQAMLDIR